MNYILRLAQPCYYYSSGNSSEIKPNLRRVPFTLEELEIGDTEIEVIQELPDKWFPFVRLIKVTEEDPDRKYFLKGYYLVGDFDLKTLKLCIDKRWLGKRLIYPAFSDKPVCSCMNQVCLSYNDTHVLVEFRRGTKLEKRKRKRK